MLPITHGPAAADAATAARSQARAEALERELHVLRVLRAEVERAQPGLILEQVDGWHSGAARHYLDRVRDLRLALAGAVHLLAEAEEVVAAEHARSRSGLAA
ncbi:hypothetical protein [Agromyces arachidis]|uniref:hypothetical protein n=1 Tax=Agromyces arachidis TaxID=766966 RepID=UPI004055F448